MFTQTHPKVPQKIRQEKSWGEPRAQIGRSRSVLLRALQMGKLPLLSPREVEANLKSLGFVRKNQVGSHRQYERPATKTQKRAVVTVDIGKKQFGAYLMKMMIRQSLLTQQEFCTGALNLPVPPPEPESEPEPELEAVTEEDEDA